MGLHRFSPVGSGRMGVQQTIATISGAALVEYGCMGHMNYAGKDYADSITKGCKIYTTHLTDTDIALGDMKRLWDAVDTIIASERPDALFLTPSSVPEMTGTDLEAAAMELSAHYPDTKIISFESGGFGASVCRGVENALDTLVNTLPEDCDKTSDFTYNIIDSCYDLFNYRADSEEIVRIMDECFGASPVCILSSNTDVNGIRKMGGAHINLVLRKEGIKAAEKLKDRFGTPFVYGRPYGVEVTVKWINEIASVGGAGVNTRFIERESMEISKILASTKCMGGETPPLYIGAHTDVVKGIATFTENELGIKVGAKWCDDPYCATDDVPYLTEEEKIKILKSGNYMIMASSEIVNFAQKDKSVIISGTDSGRYTNLQPFVGFRGAAYLAGLLIGNSEPQRMEVRTEGRHGGDNMKRGSLGGELHGRRSRKFAD